TASRCRRRQTAARQRVARADRGSDCAARPATGLHRRCRGNRSIYPALSPLTPDDFRKTCFIATLQVHLWAEFILSYKKREIGGYRNCKCPDVLHDPLLRCLA